MSTQKNDIKNTTPVSIGNGTNNLNNFDNLREVTSDLSIPPEQELNDFQTQPDISGDVAYMETPGTNSPTQSSSNNDSQRTTPSPDSKIPSRELPSQEGVPNIQPVLHPSRHSSTRPTRVQGLTIADKWNITELKKLPHLPGMSLSIPYGSDLPPREGVSDDDYKASCKLTYMLDSIQHTATNLKDLYLHELPELRDEKFVCPAKPTATSGDQYFVTAESKLSHVHTDMDIINRALSPIRVNIKEARFNKYRYRRASVNAMSYQNGVEQRRQLKLDVARANYQLNRDREDARFDNN